MEARDKRIDLRVGAFACSLQGFDDPLPALTHILNELKALHGAADGGRPLFDAETLSRLEGEIAAVAGGAVSAAPGLVLTLEAGAEEAPATTVAVPDDARADADPLAGRDATIPAGAEAAERAPPDVAATPQDEAEVALPGGGREDAPPADLEPAEQDESARAASAAAGAPVEPDEAGGPSLAAEPGDGAAEEDTQAAEVPTPEAQDGADEAAGAGNLFAAESGGDPAAENLFDEPEPKPGDAAAGEDAEAAQKSADDAAAGRAPPSELAEVPTPEAQDGADEAASASNLFAAESGGDPTAAENLFDEPGADATAAGDPAPPAPDAEDPMPAAEPTAAPAEDREEVEVGLTGGGREDEPPADVEPADQDGAARAASAAAGAPGEPDEAGGPNLAAELEDAAGEDAEAAQKGADAAAATPAPPSDTAVVPTPEAQDGADEAADGGNLFAAESGGDPAAADNLFEEPAPAPKPDATAAGDPAPPAPDAEDPVPAAEPAAVPAEDREEANLFAAGSEPVAGDGGAAGNLFDEAEAEAEAEADAEDAVPEPDAAPESKPAEAVEPAEAADGAATDDDPGSGLPEDDAGRDAANLFAPGAEEEDPAVNLFEDDAADAGTGAAAASAAAPAAGDVDDDGRIAPGAYRRLDFLHARAPAETVEEDLPPLRSHDGISAAELAKRAKADAPAELMAAAAAWLTVVKGHASFTKREVLELFEALPGDHPRTAEVKVKGFGRLVRNGRIRLGDDQRFRMSEAERDRFEDLLG